MLRMLFLDKNCWLEHIKLNQSSGLDPEGIKIRAAQGLEAADFFMPVMPIVTSFYRIKLKLFMIRATGFGERLLKISVL